MSPHSIETLERARLLLAFQDMLTHFVSKGIHDNECVTMLHLGIKLGLTDAHSYAVWLGVAPEMAARWLANYEVPTDEQRAVLVEFLITEAGIHLHLLTDAPVS